MMSDFPRCAQDGEGLLSRTVRAYETWVHHFEPETKRSRARNGTEQGIHALVSRRRKAVKVDGHFVEK
jgi:hypothetical protein